MPTSTILNLLLEGPDHKEEADGKRPSKDATDDVYEDVANEGSQDVEDVKDEADSSWANPKPHEADVPLKYKVIGIS